VALSTIYLIESGQTAKPRPKVAQAISDALGVRVGQIDEFRSAARKRKAPAAPQRNPDRPDLHPRLD
jgi:hypothetical protein